MSHEGWFPPYAKEISVASSDPTPENLRRAIYAYCDHSHNFTWDAVVSAFGNVLEDRVRKGLAYRFPDEARRLLDFTKTKDDDYHRSLYNAVLGMMINYGGVRKSFLAIFATIPVAVFIAVLHFTGFLSGNVITACSAGCIIGCTSFAFMSLVAYLVQSRNYKLRFTVDGHSVSIDSGRSLYANAIRRMLDDPVDGKEAFATIACNAYDEYLRTHPEGPQ